MGVSTDGEIAYGVLLEEGVELPWDDDKYDCEIEGWWLDQCGFVPSFYPYTEEGDYDVARGVKDGEDPRCAAYYAEKRDFLRAHPVPVEDINYCAAEYPMTMLALVDTPRVRCGRGDPSIVDLAALLAATPDPAPLMAFIEKLGLAPDEYGEPNWWLTSYWG